MWTCPYPNFILIFKTELLQIYKKPFKIWKRYLWQRSPFCQKALSVKKVQLFLINCFIPMSISFTMMRFDAISEVQFWCLKLYCFSILLWYFSDLKHCWLFIHQTNFYQNASMWSSFQFLHTSKMLANTKKGKKQKKEEKAATKATLK